MSNSEPESEAEPKVKAEENSDRIVVVDPDDYQKTKKLQSIQDSKDHFKRIKRDENEIRLELKEQLSNYERTYRNMRAKAIADYASEMIPLIEAGLESSSLLENDLIASLGPKKYEVDVRGIAKADGRIQMDGEVRLPPSPVCNEIYRQLERIERKLGLGLELETDKGPAEI